MLRFVTLKAIYIQGARVGSGAYPGGSGRRRLGGRFRCPRTEAASRTHAHRTTARTATGASR